MRIYNGRILLWCILAASVALNIALGFAARHYYIAAKVAHATPGHSLGATRQNDETKSTGGGRLVVLFGDSRVAGWSPLPVVVGYDFLTSGVPGETTSQMVSRFGTELVTLSPSTVVIQAGINDLVAAGLAPETEARIFDATLANLANMVERASSSGIQVILFTIIPPGTPDLIHRIVWSDRIPALVAAANDKLSQMHSPPAVYVLDSSTLLQSSPGVWKKDVTLDTLHLQSAGYMHLNNAVASVLSQER
jgi:lysophospholipase L1-like esterase